MTDEVLAALRQSRIFAAMDAPTLQRLLTGARRRRYPAGTLLFHAGDPGQTVYFILSGSITVRRVLSGGEVSVIAVRGFAETVGELAVLDDEARMADAVATNECDLLLLEGAVFLACLRGCPDALLELCRCLAERQRVDGERIAAARLDTCGRVAVALLRLAAERGTEPGPEGRQVRGRVTLEEVAEWAGVSPASACRALKQMAREQLLLHAAHRLILRDEAGIRRFTCR